MAQISWNLNWEITSTQNLIANLTLKNQWMKPVSLNQLQFSSVVSDSLWPHWQQHARPPCPSPAPRDFSTHVHQVSDAIQPSHPLSSLFPPAFNFPSIRVFSKELVLHIRWPKFWSFSFNISPSNEYSGLISFKIDWLDLCAAQESSLTPHFKSINSSAISFLYSPILTSIHDHWKNHSLDYMELCWLVKLCWTNVSAF